MVRLWSLNYIERHMILCWPKDSFNCAVFGGNKYEFCVKINKENIQLCWHIQNNFVQWDPRFLNPLGPLVPVLELPQARDPQVSRFLENIA